MKNYLYIMLLVILIGITGCDSDSEPNPGVNIAPSSPVHATKTLDVPALYPQIQDAVDAAKPGDVIRVAAGVYQEDLSIKSKNLSLRGLGKGLTIIQGDVEIDRSPEFSFEGFTLQGGIHAKRSTVRITGNEILESSGSGIWIEHCVHVIVTDNDIHHNAHEGIHWDISSGIIGNSMVHQNGTDGIVINNSSPGLAGNHVTANEGDGIAIRGFSYTASPFIQENTVRDHGDLGHYDIICFGGNANPTGVGNSFDRCMNCTECGSFGYPATYYE